MVLTCLKTLRSLVAWPLRMSLHPFYWPRLFSRYLQFPFCEMNSNLINAFYFIQIESSRSTCDIRFSHAMHAPLAWCFLTKI
jgi:hypothetical protein